MSNGMRIDGRSLPLSMQEQVAMELLKKGGNNVAKDRLDEALAELVAAIMEKYPGAVEAGILIHQGRAEINVEQVEHRKVEKC